MPILKTSDMAATKTTQATEAQDAGAPAALARIARAEAEAWQHHAECKAVLDLALGAEIECPMNAAEDFKSEAKVKVNAAKFALDDAEKRVQSWSKLLLSFDVKVDANRRDSEEKISHSDAAKYAKMFVIYSREALVKLAGRFADKVLATVPREVFDACAVKTREAVHNFTWREFKSCHETAINSARREAHLPQFFEDATEEMLCSMPLNTPADS